MHQFECGECLQTLDQNYVNQIVEIMKNGGLCILPSDSSYILTGLLSIRGISEDLDILLERQGMKMSLAFGSVDQAIEMMDLSCMAIKFFRNFAPGGLTFIAKPKREWLRHFSERRLQADGTIGIRLTESKVETQLAEIYPLPSTPIRNSNHKEISVADDALEIVNRRMVDNRIARDIALVYGIVPFPGRLSTVVKEELRGGVWHLRIIRESAISINKIREVAHACGYADTIID